MCVPPFLSAFGRAKSFWFSAGCLHYRFGAFGADSGGFLWNSFIRATAHDIIPAAKCLDGIFRNTEHITDFLITDTGIAKFSYFLFLLICHEKSSVPRISILIVKQKKPVKIEGINEKMPTKEKSSMGIKN